MSYLRKYYEMAENSIAERKSRNKDIQKERIAEVERKIPELCELRKKLVKGGARLSSILVSGEDPKKAVKEISEENMEVKRRIKALLAAGGFSEDYIDPIYSCEKCLDSGIYNGKRCSCFMDEVKRFQYKELNESSVMSLSSFESFQLSYYPDKIEEGDRSIRQIMGDIYDFCRKYAREFHLPDKGILMYGGTGLGKTHLSLAIGREVIDEGHSVIYGSAPDLFRKIEKEHFGSSEDNRDTVQLLQDCDLLIMDDLGAEFDSKFNQSAMYNLINTRMNLGRPVIVNTNYTIPELQDRYGGRIVSRILTMEVLPFCGEDIRVLRKING